MLSLSRRVLPLICIAYSAVSLLYFAGEWVNVNLPERCCDEEGRLEQGEVQGASLDPYHFSHYVNGPPTQSMFDNLKHDVKYITSWPSAGHTNDVITYANLIYLSMRADHVPILPPFTPNWMHFRENEETGDLHPPVEFGKVFNMSLLANAIHRPVLEWKDVKNTSSVEVDDIGCWSLYQSTSREGVVRDSRAPRIIGADISYTPMPRWVKMNEDDDGDFHSTYAQLARLLHSNTPFENHGVQPAPSRLHGAVLRPNRNLVCIDYLYFVCDADMYEYDKDFHPAWHFVGQHLRYTDYIANAAKAAVVRAAGLPKGSVAPPYIAIHARRTDFRAHCTEDGVSEADCFAPLSAFERRVQELQEELRIRKGISVSTVLMMSDESSEDWWGEVAAMGWHRVAHDPEPEYGQWWAILVDAAVQSHGVGFIGTDTSTMSLLAKLRTEDWANGATRMVRWGFLGADDH